MPQFPFVEMGVPQELSQKPLISWQGRRGPEQAWGFIWGLDPPLGLWEAKNSLKSPLSPELTQAVLISEVPAQAPPGPPPSLPRSSLASTPAPTARPEAASGSCRQHHSPALTHHGSPVPST